MKSTFLKISAIIVALNEEELIEEIINELKKQCYEGEVEIILADGGSTDKTVGKAKRKDVCVTISPHKGKASQMNAASKIASGDILFFVHADMTFPDTIFSCIANKVNKGYSGGGFSNLFDSHNQKIKKLGNLFNLRVFDKREQSDKGIFYGDNGIFVKRKIFEKLNGFKEIPIMEDYDFSCRLGKQYSTIKVENPKITVSARRHIKAGFIKTRLQWILIRMLFNWGVSPFLLKKWYQDIR